jgi:hypothetical protein
MSQFATLSYVGNNAEEFHFHETLSTLMKLLSSLFISAVPSTYLMHMKLYKIPPRLALCCTN